MMMHVVTHEMGEIFFVALEVSAERGDVCHNVGQMMQFAMHDVA